MSLAGTITSVEPIDCLPTQIRAEGPVITPVGAGLSGAKTYFVESRGQRYVLKIANRRDDPLWAIRTGIQRSAAEDGVAPRVVHVDELRYAILTEYVLDRSLGAYFGNPATRVAAVQSLGNVIRRVHALQVPGGVPKADPIGLLDGLSSVLKDFSLPIFVRNAMDQVRKSSAPSVDEVPVLSHNDMNPSNVAFDGNSIYLMDWDTAAPNERYFDLATISVFLRMNKKECHDLLSAYGESSSSLPARFVYDQKLVGVLCGSAFLNLARMNGHAGAVGSETPEGAASLGEFYQQLRSGTVRIDGPSGQWSFGLALVKSTLDT